MRAQIILRLVLTVVAMTATAAGLPSRAFQDAQTAVPAILPALSSGTSWLLRDDVDCDTRLRIATRNVTTKNERDVEQTNVAAMSIQIERAVTLAADESAGIGGTVKFVRARMEQTNGDKKEPSRPLAVEGQSYRFAMGSTGDGRGPVIEVQGNDEEKAIAAKDRVTVLLQSPGAPTFERVGTEWKPSSRAWPALVGHYLPDPPPVTCRPTAKGADA